MLGWVNISIASFIRDTFGVDKLEEVLQASGVNPNWASSCPYSDKVTYDLVVTAAGLLGVHVNDALEAYGLYFVQHVEDQGYTRLLKVLGSNLAEFLQNLNDLHLHLSYCWPSMLAPAFRCEQVTPESLLLHYYSNRPGLWPIVVGVLKGMSNDYFQLDLKVELIHSREKGDCDHEVLKLSYPYQPALRDWGKESAAAHNSFFSLSAPLFYELHPFHIIMDDQLRLLQWGAAVGRCVPELQAGRHVRDVFRVRTGASNKCKVPSYIQLEYKDILVNTNSSFVLQARSSGVTLKGQMLPTTAQLPGSAPGAPESPVLVFLASPWMRGLSDMQTSGVFLSDIPRYDLSSDYILLSEQRQAEADLKDKYERLTLELQAANKELARTTAYLEEEKARAEALLYRMSGLIACFPAGPTPAGAAAAAAQAADGRQLQQQQQPPQNSHSVLSMLQNTATSLQQQQQPVNPDKQSTALDRIEAVRRELARHNITTGDESTIQCLELLGEGTYGKVYRGLWKGSVVAVKTIVLPAVMSGQEKREKMAIMEAAISSALSHPNIMQTYTYDIKPIKDTSRHEQKLVMFGSTSSTAVPAEARSSQVPVTAASDNIHSYEVRLVCEYCDRGSLREALDLGAFNLPDGSVNYPAVLDTAIEVATAMSHLHNRNVLHSDLKARNIMLKSTGSSGRGVTAKIADFGLAVQMDHMETHMSNAFQGTYTHMAPEILLKGRISKAADVYAFGMVLYELYTAQKVFKGIPRALLGHQITQLNRRPEFPAHAPADFVALAQSCWDPVPAKRLSLDAVLERLQALRAALRQPTEPLAPYDIEAMIARKFSVGTGFRAPAAAGNGAAYFGGAGQHAGPSAAGAAAAAAAAAAKFGRSPGAQPHTAVSTHAGRAMQQQQRTHRPARRVVSTPALKPGGQGSPVHVRQQQLGAQSVASASPHLLSLASSTTPGAAGGVVGGSSSSNMARSRGGQGSAAAAAAAAAAGSALAAAGSAFQDSSASAAAAAAADSSPQVGDEHSSDAPRVDGYGDSRSDTEKSVYLEHSASTAHGEEDYQDWSGVDEAGNSLEASLSKLQLPADNSVAAELLQHGQQAVGHLQQPASGAEQVGLQQQDSRGDSSSKAAVARCPFAAMHAAAGPSAGAATATAAAAARATAEGQGSHASLQHSQQQQQQR